MDLGLKGKLAVITGGSVGIGLAVAEGLAGEGCNVLLTARGKERVEVEAARVSARHGGRAVGGAAEVEVVEANAVSATTELAVSVVATDTTVVEPAAAVASNTTSALPVSAAGSNTAAWLA